MSKKQNIIVTVMLSVAIVLLLAALIICVLLKEYSIISVFIFWLIFDSLLLAVWIASWVKEAQDSHKNHNQEDL